MSKTIEEIKTDVINEVRKNGVGNLKEFTTEVAERYAQYQTQYLIKSLDAKQGQIDKLIKKYDRREVDFKSQTQELQEQNAELVEMLNHWFLEYGYGADRFCRQELVDMTENLLTKHNHLNKKP